MRTRLAFDPGTLFAPDILISAQGRDPSVPCLPERRLMAAVLESAMEELRHGPRPREFGRPATRSWGPKRKLRVYTPATHYIRSHDRRWPLAFENICDHLSLSADDIRATLQRKGLL